MTHTAFPLLLCPDCNGTGKKNGERCAACNGAPVYGWHEGNVIVFSAPLDPPSLTLAVFRSIIRGFVNGCCVFYGIAGFLLFAAAMGGFIPRTSAIATVFWVSVLIDCFAYRRMVRESEEYVEITLPRYGEQTIAASRPNDWSSAHATPKKEQVNVARTCTPEALRAIRRAVRIAERLQNANVSPVHLFASLLSDKSVGIIFGRLGIASSQVTDKLKHFLSLETRGNAPSVTPALHGIFFSAYATAVLSRRRRTDVTELLSALASDGGVCEQILFDLEAGGDRIQNVIAWIALHRQLRRTYSSFRKKARLKPGGDVDRAMTAVATPLLDRVSRDMTRLARNGYLAPCVGREREVEEVLRIIESGRQNVLLIGNPGVGKTAIVEGIAQRMVEEDVPDILFDKRLVSLSIPTLLSGAAKTGELEERLQRMLYEIIRAGNVILFIDNIHELIGVTTTGGSAFDLSQVLTSLLEKHAFLAIGATSPAEHKRYLEKAGAFSVVFQPVRIEEMDVAGTILVLESKAGGMEYKNNVYFSYDAIEKTATLSRTYIQDRYLPDKALKVLEEAAVYVRKKEGKNAIVTGEHIAELISEKTKIPVTKVGAGEKEKLLHLEEEMHKRIIGQDEAVSVVASSLRRARAGMRDVKRPIANFLFLGPTGVGKTELAKTLAEVYFGDEKNMIRLDMSEYQEKTSLGRLLGTTGGEGGYLASAVRKNPFALVLLDEIEKAHPDILNVFLQVMDDGRMTDAEGTTIDFTNTIIIATSNAGAQFIQDAVQKGTDLAALKEQLVRGELRQNFRPEFLNRFDAIVLFRPLSFEEIKTITALMIKKVGARLEEKGITFSATPSAIEELAHTGFDPIFGARPLRRAVQEKVDDAIASVLLKGEAKHGDRLFLEKGGAIRVEKQSE
ncbi:AAA family ATPase [Candidatus Uhrbacteria bacterium]|nr:AAA family ATPase [Candidatus Uhrbacteria bacterium]